MWISVIAPARAQWTEPVRISEPGECWYPQILAHGDTLHVVYENETGGWKISYVRSTDGGQTWSPHQVLSDTINTTQTLLPRIMKNGNSILALWITYFPQQVYWYDIGYRLSGDNGITWGPFEYVLDPNWPGSFYMTASGADSLINIITSGYSGGSTIYKNIISTDFGTTWSQPRPLFTIFHSGRTDCASHDTLVHLSWTGRSDLDHKVEVYYSSSANGGLDWGPSIPLSDTDQFHSQMPSIITNDYGTVDLTWMDFKYASPGWTGDIFSRRGFGNGSNWTLEVQITQRHKSSLSDVVSKGDTLYVAWQDERSENGRFSIYFSQSIDGGINWSEEYRLDVDSMQSLMPALAQSNGRVFAIWADRRCEPDTDICGGIYFTQFPTEPSALENEQDSALIEAMRLAVYPNPTNLRVIITYFSKRAGEIRIFNSLGQIVNRFKAEALVDGKIIWDGTDQNGKRVTSGVYFFKLQSGDRTKIAKVIYLK